MNFIPKISSFEGPLDLLLHLIEKNEIDIYDIPIAMITDQYMEFLNAADEEDTDLLSEFLVMAAQLLEIKARMLLPKEENEEEEDPREDLVNRLLEYKLYKYMSLELKEKENEAAKSFFKEPAYPADISGYAAPVDYDLLFEDITLDMLTDIYNDVMNRYKETQNEEAKKYGRIKKEKISLPQKIEEIKSQVFKNRKSSFRSLLGYETTKENIIVTFLAVLELMRSGHVAAKQKNEDIELIWTGQN